ncbi:MAG TPA: NAD(P)H-hydrate epimerase [Candidatus Solibacter sp.]|nr:NAD(P)H-hydrate epimerase [Candidatus Solibacter sp.]
MANFTSWKSGVSPEQMREIDRATEADYGISPLQLMEVAGLATARVARNLIGSPLTGRRVCILAGPGNNGADGLVAARRLAGWGANVAVLTSYRIDEARGLSATQLRPAEATGVPVAEWDGEVPAAELLIDALLGFGASGAPRATIATMIGAAVDSGAPVLALDIPSGLDAATGVALGACIVATATVTLALPKTGLLAPPARQFVGRLFLADIGVPNALLEHLGISIDGIFAGDDIVEIEPGGS